MKWITSLQNTVYLKLISAEIESLRTLISKKKSVEKVTKELPWEKVPYPVGFKRGNSTRTL